MNVFRLQTRAIPIVKVGIVGLGERGLQAVNRLSQLGGSYISAICDISEEKLSLTLQMLKNDNITPTPSCFTDYHQLCKQDGIDLIYICTDWLTHTNIILEALEHGKHVAVEVPAATTLDDIRAIVDAAEQTQRHCMMLENCVYDFFEMGVCGMVRRGLFGEVVHVEGGYAHPIGDKWPLWRLEYNNNTRGDVYPTHGIGPACQILDIHRSDYLQTLVSMDSASFMGSSIYQEHTGKESNIFQNGDQTTTIIRTTKGKTILLQHNVMTPRPYSRMFQVVGTKGYAEKYPQPFIECEDVKDVTMEKLVCEYAPSYIDTLTEKGRKLDSRGGMAYFMDWRLIHCLNHGLPLDMDVYDLAEWCAVAELSRKSIELGFKAVEIPQFI
ncbi:MAG: Gfo/Idh/MocA family oxidoreductase [Prevotella sp.]|nr:Gfo/Idh/MocA family oxidoreductase [Prevotella sp.]